MKRQLLKIVITGWWLAGVVLAVPDHVGAQIHRPYCDSSNTCETSGDVLHISAGMGLFDSDCNYIGEDESITNATVLEARIIEYDANGNVIYNEDGEAGSWILANDLTYCVWNEEGSHDGCGSEGFYCTPNYATGKVDCTLDLSKTICWRKKNESIPDECHGPWEMNEDTVRIEVNLLYRAHNRMMCCEPGSDCYFCSCDVSAVAVTPEPPVYITDVCVQLGDKYDQCHECIERGGFWTGLGCIAFDIVGFASNLMLVGFSFAGGFALLRMLQGAFTIATSSGNQELLQEGQQIFVSAVIGVLFIILSVTFLKFIGVDVLNIPDF